MRTNDIKQKIRAEYKTMRALVKYVLTKYPNTHNSDTKLIVKICRVLDIKSMTELYNSNLNIMSIHRTRRALIANNEIEINKDVLEYRKKKANLVKEYFNSHK